MDSVSVPSGEAALVARLALATLLGAVIGFNREFLQKPAGLRTHALVALGAALAALTGVALTEGSDPDVSAPARVIQGIVAGVGFIGGGVILHRQDAREVHGLTTAASIWIVSATGVAVGIGLWRAALAGIALALLVLTIGGQIDRAVRHVGPARRDDD